MSTYRYSPLELKLRAECERGFKIAPRVGGHKSPTGENFRQLVLPGLDWSRSEDEVYEAALDAFHQYSKARAGTLYWRVYPEIAHDPRGWRFYMRLLISNKPLKTQALANAEELR